MYIINACGITIAVLIQFEVCEGRMVCEFTVLGHLCELFRYVLIIAVLVFMCYMNFTLNNEAADSEGELEYFFWLFYFIS
jgi:hypothetical protein